MAVLDAPPLSVTVSDAAYVPATSRRAWASAPVATEPSPNDHAHDFTQFRQVTRPEPSKLTVSGATPVVGVTEMTTAGDRLPTAPRTSQQVMSAS